MLQILVLFDLTSFQCTSVLTAHTFLTFLAADALTLSNIIAVNRKVKGQQMMSVCEILN